MIKNKKPPAATGGEEKPVGNKLPCLQFNIAGETCKDFQTQSLPKPEAENANKK